MHKRRITITVDETLLAEVNAAVSEGRARSVSEWVSNAMSERRTRDRHLALLDELISGYEAEHGFITGEEVAEQVQRDRDAAASSRVANRRAG